MAARVGTTRSRINHFMSKFRKRLVEYKGELKVHASLLSAIVRDQRARDLRTFLVERYVVHLRSSWRSIFPATISVM